ncbi:hypothetical protein TNCV_1334821 [Trichonephila clavipes]|nr:hypothetical protein TNCV_1334821 [Trichonephila clavipes]
MNKIWRTPAGMACPIILLEEFNAVDHDNVYTTPITPDKDISEIIQSSINVDADSDDENEGNNAAPVPTSPHVIKSMRRYLDAHSNGEMNNKMDVIEQCVDNLIL